MKQHSGRYSRSSAFNEAVTKRLQSYTVNVSLASALQPQTAVKENFSVYSYDTDEEFTVKDAVYLPGSMKIKLLLEPAEMTSTYCKVIASDSLKYLGDASYESQMTGAVQREKVCDIFDVSVQQVSVYQDEKIVIQPDISNPLSVAAKVVNSSGSTQKKTVVLFLDKDVSNPIQTKEIIIDANSTADILFELPEGISEQKIINAVVL